MRELNVDEIKKVCGGQYSLDNGVMCLAPEPPLQPVGIGLPGPIGAVWKGVEFISTLLK
jgi:hypothetical protein